ncbi:AAA family ATPase (plasmid) [Halorarum halophilum]|uniref:ORC1-type DNA replication protein n=1 Tax=Halorarum halophilum TaxID=2743090 RepID=A0A7D5GES4_9EURY|nr:AAA family ATPase [Halobaculum halophilum]QLG30046.1 AAA family ATPase [Halobaculum halophilum]
MERLTPEDEIFQNEDALRDHYPDRILERDEKLTEYQNKFKEVVRNKRPRNVFVYGPTGVGKTIGTKAVLQNIQDSIDEFDYADSRFEEPSLRAVHLECKDLNTSYQVAAHLVNQLRLGTDRDQINTTGYPEGRIYQMLFDELQNVEESHVLIALDEIDNIGGDDNILYKLPRCNNDNSANHVDPDDTKVGVIGVTNDGTFKDTLDPRAKSTLCDREIHFPPYNANELQTIMRDRARVAFHDGVLTDDVIPLAAALAAQRSGYARTALDLLYEAADRARDSDEGIIEARHVREAEEGIQQGAIVKEVKGLSSQGTLVSYAMVRLDEEHELPAKLDKVYAWYERFAKQIDADTVTPRTVHTTLNDLMINGVVTSREVNKGVSGGRHYEYELGCPKELVMDGMEGNSRLSDIDDRLS